MINDLRSTAENDEQFQELVLARIAVLEDRIAIGDKLIRERDALLERVRVLKKIL